MTNNDYNDRFTLLAVF